MFMNMVGGEKDKEYTVNDLAKRERISMMSGYHLGKLVAPFTGIGIVVSQENATL